jgi:hypothetical protein
MQKSFSDLESPAQKKPIGGDRVLSMLGCEPPRGMLLGTAPQKMRWTGSPFAPLRRQSR